MLVFFLIFYKRVGVITVSLSVKEKIAESENRENPWFFWGCTLIKKCQPISKMHLNTKNRSTLILKKFCRDQKSPYWSEKSAPWSWFLRGLPDLLKINTNILKITKSHSLKQHPAIYILDQGFDLSAQFSKNHLKHILLTIYYSDWLSLSQIIDFGPLIMVHPLFKITTTYT